ncbi:hypothetical protein NDU88_002532 [Pleurodeles waltl]|uniref:Uncharacterized protein n=1 Tax=Pleurodeles waltl TaxID=8319 RepID=A0AAV7SDD0_PLEWA|nr:hypothetical protein NDU88_002532 [Pleurodeles waltl]
MKNGSLHPEMLAGKKRVKLGDELVPLLSNNLEQWAVLRSPKEIDIGTGPEFSHAAPSKAPSVVEWLTQQRGPRMAHQDLEPAPATAVTVQGEPEASRAGEQGSRKEVQSLLSQTTALLRHCTVVASAPEAAAPARTGPGPETKSQTPQGETKGVREA